MVLAQAFHYAAGKVKGSINSGCAEVLRAAPFDRLVVFYVSCSRSRPVYVQYNQTGWAIR
jgi:hypothetical protein